LFRFLIDHKAYKEGCIDHQRDDQKQYNTMSDSTHGPTPPAFPQQTPTIVMNVIKVRAAPILPMRRQEVGGKACNTRLMSRKIIKQMKSFVGSVVEKLFLIVRNLGARATMTGLSDCVNCCI
jgi:hypothetical protein